MKIRIAVALHKEYRMPEDEIYVPVLAGACDKPDLGYERDDTGDNISGKNPCYSELTVLYWAWKNLESEYIGLVHYRRHFSLKEKGFHKSKGPFDSVMTLKEAKVILSKYNVILPKKRKYYIESLYSHYAHTLDKTHLDIAKSVIENKYPEYLSCVDTVYNRTWGYMWNMMIMKKDLLDKYCNWLFSILFEMENHIDVTKLSDFDKRLFGRVSEILFNVWVLHNKDMIGPTKEITVISTEPVPWGKKIKSFLLAKFFGKKYDGSF